MSNAIITNDDTAKSETKQFTHTSVLYMPGSNLLNENGTYEINVEYTHSLNRPFDVKRLSISIPEFYTPSEHLGLSAIFEFNRYPGETINNKIIREKGEYGHNKELEDIFDTEIKPFLEKNLPKYMLRVMQASYSE